MLKRNSYTQKARQELCSQYLTSGQSRKDFCQKHNVSLKSLGRWLLKSASKPKALEFISIGKLSAKPVLSEVKLPNGIIIKVSQDVSDLQSMIRGLL